MGPVRTVEVGTPGGDEGGDVEPLAGAQKALDFAGRVDS